MNGHIYMFITTGRWTDAEAQAVALGGHLATIRNKEEEDWIYNVFAFYGRLGGGNLWIGLNDVQTPGQFVWASGEPVTYTHWGAGQPSGGLPIGHYVAINSYITPYGGFVYSWANWIDFGDFGNPYTTPFNGIVEIIPPPEHGHSHDKDKKDKD